MLMTKYQYILHSMVDLQNHKNHYMLLSVCQYILCDVIPEILVFCRLIFWWRLTGSPLTSSMFYFWQDDLRIGSVFSVAPAQMLPVIHPSSGHMSCSHCKKNLMKGQTAFQRRGSPALFCSTSCLTTSLPTVKGPSKFCHNCQKWVL